MLDKSLGSFVDSGWDVKHRQWVADELRQLAAAHGLNLGGEGVANGAVAGNTNQSTPQAKNPQCASLEPLTVDRKINDKAAALACAKIDIEQGASLKPQDMMPDFASDRPFMLPGKVASQSSTVTLGSSPDAMVSTMTVASPMTAPQVVDVPQGNGEHKSVPLWPTECELKVLGYCPNPRLLVAVLPDGRTRVSMNRGGRNWRAGDKVMARLSQGGGSPIYSPV